MLDHPIPTLDFGWGTDDSLEEKIVVENRYFDAAVADNPTAYQSRPAKELNPEMMKNLV